MRKFTLTLALAVAVMLAAALVAASSEPHVRRGGERKANHQHHQQHHAAQCRIAANYGLTATAGGVLASIKASSAGSCCRKCETHSGCAVATFDRAASVCHLRAALPKREHIAPSPATDLILTLRTPLPKDLAAAFDSNAALAPVPAHDADQVQCGSGVCVSGWLCCNSPNGAQQCYDPEFQQCCAAEDVSFVCGLSQQCCIQSGAGGIGSCCTPGLCMQVTGTCARPTTPAPTIAPCGSPQGGTACPGTQVCCGYYAAAVCYDPAVQQCCQASGTPVLCATGSTCCTQAGTTSTTCCASGSVCDADQGQCFVPTTTPAPPMCGSSYCAPGAMCCGQGGAGAVCYDPTAYACCSTSMALVCSQKYLQSCCVSTNGQYGSCCSSGSLCNATTGGCFVPPQSTAAPAPTGPACGANYCAPNMECCGQVCFDPSVNTCCAALANVVCNAQQTCCSGAPGGACCNSGYVCNANDVVCYLPTSMAPAPTGPACAGGNCAPDRQCCGNNTCYNAANAQCCAGGGNVCAGYSTCCYSAATGNSGCCSEGQICDTGSGTCYNTAAPTTGVPCGQNVCSVTMQCCGQICYDPSVTSCCSAANNVVCNAVQTCCAAGGDAVCCNSNSVCAQSVAVCYPNTTTAAPAPTGPACLGGYCRVGQQCCENSGCYDPARTQCCASNFQCAADRTCCFNATGQGMCCAGGQVCDSQQGWCTSPTPAPSQTTCGGAVCVGGEICCGGAQCYDPNVAECCVGPSPAVCAFTSNAVCCPYGANGGSCCAQGYVCDPSANGCVASTPAPTVPMCGNTQCPAPYSCCGFATDGECFNSNTSYCCSSGANWQVCSMSQSCNSTTGQCWMPTPAPTVPTCGGTQCASPYQCCGGTECYNPAASFCCSSGTTSSVCNNGQNCNTVTGQCWTPTPAPTVPLCGNAQCPAPYSCCGYATDGECYDSDTSYCCSSGANWQVCSASQSCNSTTGQCSTPTPAPTVVPTCGGYECSSPNYCCASSECYNPAFSFCCISGTNWAVCSNGQTCNATTGQCQNPTSAPVPTAPPTPAPTAAPQCGGYACSLPNACCGTSSSGRCFNPGFSFCCYAGQYWAVCNNGQTCNSSTGQCETPTPAPVPTPAPTPAPSVPMCGGSACGAPYNCCAGAQCYNPGSSFCCTAGTEWAVCNNGQTCNATTGQCQTATPAPAPGIPCGQGECTGSQNECCGYPGNGVCFDTQTQICCQAGLNFVCTAAQTCCVSRNGLVTNCCASGATCDQESGSCF